MMALDPRRAATKSAPAGWAPLRTLYVLWSAIGLSILLEFAVLLALQRGGTIGIAPAVADGAGPVHLAAAGALFLLCAVAVVALRRRVRNAGELAGGRPSAGAAPAPFGHAVVPRRVLSLSLIAWAITEALALAGLVVAIAFQPAPRLALMLYFTGALLLWLWSRPAPEAVRGPSPGRSST